MFAFQIHHLLKNILSLILITLLFYFCSLSSDSDNDHNGDIPLDGRLRGAFYFNLLNPTQIIRYEFARDTFEVIVDQSKSPGKMNVSANHRYLSFHNPVNSIHFIDLVSGIERIYTSSYQLLNDLSMNGDGELLACPAIVEVDTMILLVYADSFQKNVFDAWQYCGARHVLFSNSNYTLAWMSSRGLFVRNLTTTDILHFSADLLIPDDFSPSARYLAAGGRIFSTWDGQLYPGKVSGRIKFIDDRSVLFREDGLKVIKKANLSGTEISDLYETRIQDALFCVSADGSFAAIMDKYESELTIVLLDLETREILRTIYYPLTSQALAGDFYWRYPALLTPPVGD